MQEESATEFIQMFWLLIKTKCNKLMQVHQMVVSIMVINCVVER